MAKRFSLKKVRENEGESQILNLLKKGVRKNLTPFSLSK